MGIISFPLIHPAPILASCVGIHALIIFGTTSIVPLWVGSGESDRMGNLWFSLRYMISPARERAFNLHRYNAYVFFLQNI